MRTTGRQPMREERRSMMRIRLALLAGLLLLLAAPAGAYEISDYRAVFAVQPGAATGARDVKVHLRLVYQVGNETKSDGFKYVGDASIAEAAASDDAGNRLGCQVDRQRETRIRWFFPAVRNG